VHVIENLSAYVQALRHWKAKNVTYSESVFVALSSKKCACAILYSHLWQVRLENIFQPSLIEARISKNVIEYKIWVLIFSTNLPETFLIISRPR